MAKDYGDAQEAFNAGCDARIAGRLLSANPYTGAGSLNQWTAWKEGWEDCNDHWGALAKGPVRKLPRIA